jgi:hypothetical protein
MVDRSPLLLVSPLMDTEDVLRSIGEWFPAMVAGAGEGFGVIITSGSWAYDVVVAGLGFGLSKTGSGEAME